MSGKKNLLLLRSKAASGGFMYLVGVRESGAGIYTDWTRNAAEALQLTRHEWMKQQGAWPFYVPGRLVTTDTAATQKAEKGRAV